MSNKKDYINLTTNISEILERIKAKAEMASYLPSPRDLFTDPLEYAKKNYYRFDEERWESDESYREATKDDMMSYNNRAKAFNDILEEVYRILD